MQEKDQIEFIGQISKFGASYYILIPASVSKYLRPKKGQIVRVKILEIREGE